MKTKLKLLAVTLALVALAYGLFTPPEAQSNPNRASYTVLVFFKGLYGPRDPITGSLTQLGLQVDWAQSSVGAPVVAQGYSAAQTIADLTTQGYQYHVIGVNYWLFIK